MSGLSGSAVPVAGFTRRIAPSRLTGSPPVRRSCERSAPPWPGRSLRAADPGGRIPARVLRSRTSAATAALAIVGKGPAGTLAPADVECPVGPEGQVSDRVGGVLLAPALDQDLFRAGHRIRSSSACRRDRRPLTTQPSLVPPGGSGQCRPSAAPYRASAHHECTTRTRRGWSGSLGRLPAREAAIRIVLNFGAQVGESGGRGVREVIEDLDQATLFSHEDPSRPLRTLRWWERSGR